MKDGRDSAAVDLELPTWARVSPRRREHIIRVTSLLLRWADLLGLGAEERNDWRDAGRLHDALRDAPESELRALVTEPEYDTAVLHGPAAADALLRDGETRTHVLDAIRYHTVGHTAWDRTGRALYMADFLEPGRTFGQADRAFLAAQVAHDFDGVFRQVVRSRCEWALREGHALYAETVSLWNAIR
ncbi:MAG TPA: HD domain-containing protein [Gemmatimonadaceae bacterium]|nr:HD domain-containing protein [Gemmatimonadaceae bacterium]